MKFQHTLTWLGNDCLCLKTDEGADIEVVFKDGAPSEVYVDEVDYSATDERLHPMFFIVEKGFMRVSAIVSDAALQYDDIMREVRRERADEEAMARELSSPEQTGRV